MLRLEQLDDRITPASGFDARVFAARLETPTQIRFTYFENDPVLVPVGVYRSADPVFDAGDQLVGAGLLGPQAGIQPAFGTINLPGELPIDLARPFVIVQADPLNQFDEFSESNNIAVFRTITVAAVTHGLSLTGDPGAFVTPIAAGLKAEGYDFAFPFIWTQLSQTPSRDATVTAGRTLAQMVRAVADTLAGPNDVVDVHLIGHSRGASVVSQAFQSLTDRPGSRALAVGYFKETLLDPHSATNFAPPLFGALEVLSPGAGVGTSLVGQFSFDRGNPLGVSAALAVLNFQAVANDPLPVIPAGVDEAEVYYQQLPADQATWVPPGAGGSVEQALGINLFGQVPVANPAGRFVRYIDLSPQRVGHSEVLDWFALSVVPTLGG
jgi:hypothetical protein